MVISLLLSACAHRIPVLPTTTVPAPVVPVPPAVKSPATFGYLRVHHLARTLDSVGAGSVVEMAAKRGIDLGALDPERPLVFVVGDAGGQGWDNTPLRGVIPVPPGGPLAQALARALGPEHVTTLEGGVAVAVHAPPFDARSSADLASLSRAPLASDLEMCFDVALLMDRYGEVVRGWFDELQRDIEKETPRASDPELTRMYYQWLRGALDGVRWASLGYTAGDEDLSVDFVEEEKGQSPPPLPAKVEQMPSLGQFLPPGEVRMEVDAANGGWLKTLALRIYERLLKDEPATLARVKPLVDRVMGGRMQMGMSMSFAGTSGLTATAVLLADAAGDRYAAWRDLLQSIDPYAVTKAYEKVGLHPDVKIAHGARKVHGFTVDRVSYAVTAVPGNKQGEAAARMIKPLSIEILQADNCIVYTLNGAPGALESLRPANTRGNWPRLDATLPPITGFGYTAGPIGYYRMSLPRRLVQNFREMAGQASRQPLPKGE